MNAKQQWGQRLAERMAAQGFSDNALAKEVRGLTTDGRGYMVGKSRSQVGHWRRGKQVPNEESRAKLAKLLGDDILDGLPPFKQLRPKAQSEPASTQKRHRPRLEDVAFDLLCTLSREELGRVMARVLSELGLFGP
jgi:transcriptional regulator with XRE-family HTH domain